MRILSWNIYGATIAYGKGEPMSMFVGHLPQKKKQVPYLDALYQLNIQQFDNAIIIGDLNCGIPFEICARTAKQ